MALALKCETARSVIVWCGTERGKGGCAPGDDPGGERVSPGSCLHD